MRQKFAQWDFSMKMNFVPQNFIGVCEDMWKKIDTNTCECNKIVLKIFLEILFLSDFNKTLIIEC